MPLADVDTPALIVDLDALERNCGVYWPTPSRPTGVRLRPHAKSTNPPRWPRRQMALGAVGVCCQKVAEAEVMVAGGITDVLVSNEVAARASWRGSRPWRGRARHRHLC
jgi:D-serine deaminase-like pyridoxal phosphate-dependent protein